MCSPIFHRLAYQSQCHKYNKIINIVANSNNNKEIIGKENVLPVQNKKKIESK